MLRSVSRWAVTALGVVMAGCGMVAMIAGWDMIQVERGWSLFIGGAAVLAGGAVVVALGQVVVRLDDLLGVTRTERGEGWAARSTNPVAKPQTKEAQSKEPRPKEAQPKDSERRPVAPQPSRQRIPWPAPPASGPSPTPAGSAPTGAPTQPPASTGQEPARAARPPAIEKLAEEGSREVDRYKSGNVTYVMYSDGAVEVRSAGVARRFSSLAELRAQAAEQH